MKLLRRRSNCKQCTWQNMWNTLNFLPQPPCMISWDIDKFHFIQASILNFICICIWQFAFAFDNFQTHLQLSATEFSLDVRSAGHGIAWGVHGRYTGYIIPSAAAVHTQPPLSPSDLGHRSRPWASSAFCARISGEGCVTLLADLSQL
jgi:hypothetical protein